MYSPSDPRIHVVLVNPEIPQNTGNIARTCAAVGASLHLIEPLGFSTDDKYLKRAGLDYWHLVDVHRHANLQAYYDASPGYQRFFATKKIGAVYSTVSYSKRCAIFFGSETDGLPESMLMDNVRQCIRIPMTGSARSLNLSNAAAIIVYEVLRQHGFGSLSIKGPGFHGQQITQT